MHHSSLPRWLILVLALMLMLPSAALANDETSGGGLNPGQRASDAAPPQADGRYLIEFFTYGPQSAAIVRNAGGRVIHEFRAYNTIAAHLPAQALSALQNNPNVRSVEVDPRRYPAATTTATATATSETVPYGISMVQADQVADDAIGNREVCIIDSGLYTGHEDIQDANVTASPNSGTGDPFTDLFGHGTHVAGTIAALTNHTGVRGVAGSGQLNLHVVKVFGDDGAWAYSSDLVTALNACRSAGANVVNMSLGGSLASRFEERAFNDAYQAGILSVAAAGNDGTTRKSYPASYASVVSVAAIDSTKAVASFSQQNNEVELAAPGVGVLSTVPWLDETTVTVDGVTYQAAWIEFAARTSGVSGALVNGGRCTASGSWTGQVVLCERGDISFFDKVTNVQQGGGVAAVIYNNEPGNFYGTLGDGNSSTIPAVSLSQEDGQYLVANKLGQSATVVSTSTKPASGYEAWDGTSMATPHVAGVAALVWSHNPNWKNTDIRAALQKTAQDLGAAGRDNAYGYGLVQAKAALDYLQGTGGGDPTDTTAPVISNVSAQRIHKNGNFSITWTTDDAATSQVTFVSGTTGTYTDSALVQSHAMTFKGRNGVRYVYYVASTNASGLETTAGPFEFQN